MNEYTTTSRNGTKYYYKDKAKKILHREDGPAVVDADGNKIWWLNGKCHRIDGPALERYDGFKSWYVNGVFIFAIDKNGKLDTRMK